MAEQNINTLKQYFLSEKTPTQQQFFDLLDSIVVKGGLTVADINGLTELLQGKQDTPAPGTSNTPDIMVFNGDGYYDIPANHFLETIKIVVQETIYFKIGETAGGEEILPGIEVSTDEAGVITLHKFAKTTTRIYLSGMTANTQITFYKL